MSYQTLETKITQVCNKVNSLKTDILNINNAFEEKGVEVDNTPSEEYGFLIDEANYNAFVKIYEGNTRTSWNGYFGNLNNLIIMPEIDTSSGTDFQSMFSNCKSLKEVRGLDTSNATLISSIFAYCESLEKAPPIDLSGVTTSANHLFYHCYKLKEATLLGGQNVKNWVSTFRNCRELETICKPLNVSSATGFGQTFYYCVKLKNITFEGVIPVSISFAESTLLTHESLMSIINHLKDYSGTTTTYTLTIGETNLAKLTDAEKAIATQKGWSLA